MSQRDFDYDRGFNSGEAERATLQSKVDRVTAERDAVQQRLTAADERADVLEGLLRSLPEDLKDLSGSENTAGVYACIEYIEQCVAALKLEDGGGDEHRS